MTSNNSDLYNGRVSDIRLVHDELMVLRIVPDDGTLPAFEAGQYAVLGLGSWEPRDDGVRPHGPTTRLVRRAYSFSCPMLDEAGSLVTVSQSAFVEFYIARVSRATDDPPMLTPRLFALSTNDRILFGPRPHGHYTLAPVHQDDDVLFFATGTGEAPHNAMVAELLSRGHAGMILTATCTRYRRDLAYLAVHRELEKRFSNYRYVALTTREPKNLDSARADFVGKQYLQEFVSSGQLDSTLGKPVDPGRTHVYLCGNPAMIGSPKHVHGDEWLYPEPLGMSEVLTKRGFRLDAPRTPGNVHFEKYW